jgi:hypothetical protein
MKQDWKPLDHEMPYVDVIKHTNTYCNTRDFITVEIYSKCEFLQTLQLYRALQDLLSEFIQLIPVSIFLNTAPTTAQYNTDHLKCFFLK